MSTGLSYATTREIYQFHSSLSSLILFVPLLTFGADVTKVLDRFLDADFGRSGDKVPSHPMPTTPPHSSSSPSSRETDSDGTGDVFDALGGTALTAEETGLRSEGDIVGDSAANSELEAPERRVDARLCTAVVNLEAPDDVGLPDFVPDPEALALALDLGATTVAVDSDDGNVPPDKVGCSCPSCACAWSCSCPSFLPTVSTNADKG